MEVGALQETTWFKCEVYEIGGSVVLTAGRAMPAQDEAVQRKIGVALILRFGSGRVEMRREAAGGLEHKAR